MADQDNIVYPPQFTKAGTQTGNGGDDGGINTVEERLEALEQSVFDMRKYLGVGMRMLRSMRKKMVTKEDVLESRLTDLKWFIGALLGLAAAFMGLVFFLIRSLPTA